ncbi:MAG: type II toxin-antitoxin system HicA family toxin [Fimbriimonadaceae bacterium]|nr:type II toxin-antitoxin system HicA family toxin [Fimbriimonadaceae bacterium]
MRLPRDVSGRSLTRALARLGYAVTRQTGSHMRLTTERGGRHNITIPDHSALRVGTLAAIVAEVASHHQISREELVRSLFDSG